MTGIGIRMKELTRELEAARVRVKELTAQLAALRHAQEIGDIAVLKALVADVPDEDDEPETGDAEEIDSEPLHWGNRGGAVD